MRSDIKDYDFEAQLFVKATQLRGEEKGLNAEALLMACAGYCVQELQDSGREGLALQFCKFLVLNIETKGRTTSIGDIGRLNH